MDPTLSDLFDTELHEAVRYGDIEDVAVALQQGLDPNLIGVYQWNPLHEASHNGDFDSVRLLLQHKGDPNKQDLLKGNSPVHYAAQEGHLKCLQLLLDNGGLIDLYNNDGQTCVAVANSVCKDILRRYALKNSSTIRSDSLSPDPSVNETASIKQDAVNDTTGLGYIHLSFEYHAKKSSLKIRVWELSDLLVPPGNTSLINTIFVKGFLVPDEKKELKRQTEEVKIEKADSNIHSVKHSLSIQHILRPSSFKFCKSLDYKNVSDKTIHEKSVQLEVYVTQKNSRKKYLIALWHLPLKLAVKKLVKEKFPLIQCLNQTIPNQMRIYSGSQLNLSNSTSVYHSNPNVRRETQDSISDSVSIAVSDVDIPHNASKHFEMSVPEILNNSCRPTEIEMNSLQSTEIHKKVESGTLDNYDSKEAFAESPPTMVHDYGCFEVFKSEISSYTKSQDSSNGKECILLQEMCGNEITRKSESSSRNSELLQTDLQRSYRMAKKNVFDECLPRIDENTRDSRIFYSQTNVCENSVNKKHKIVNQSRNRNTHIDVKGQTHKTIRSNGLPKNSVNSPSKKSLSKVESKEHSNERVLVCSDTSSQAYIPKDTVVSIDQLDAERNLPSHSPNRYKESFSHTSYQRKDIPIVVIDMVDNVEDNEVTTSKTLSVMNRKKSRMLPKSEKGKAVFDDIAPPCVTRFSIINENIPLSARSFLSSIDSDTSSISQQDSGIFDADDVNDELTMV